VSVLLPGRRLLAVSVSVSLVAGVVATTAAFGVVGDDAPPQRYAAVEQQRAPLPGGSATRGRAGVEQSALQLAAALDAVPVRADGDGDEATRYCPHDRLEVRWSVPGDEYAVGGYVTPVGPAPGDSTESVNGIVVCAGASYAYMGFEGSWSGTAWSVEAVPALSDEHDVHEQEAAAEHEEHGDAEENKEPGEHGEHEEHAAPVPAPARPAAPAAARRGFTVPALAGIDPYAAYDPQRSCDPVAKPGMVALRDLLLGTYRGTRNLGVVRSCTARGVSEHKEGRAFDWGVNVGVASERAAAESVLSQLLATDAAGHRHALARRLGVMYVIWDRRIWSSYRPDAGWRPYSGANAHTDHVHMSLSWAGAMGRTSYWQGDNASLLRFDPELVLAAPTGGTAAGARLDGNRAARVSGESEREPVPHRPKPRRTEQVEEHLREPRAERKGGGGQGHDRKRGRDEAPEPSPVAEPVAAPLAPAAAAPAPVPVAAPRTARPPKPVQPAKPVRTAAPVKAAKPVRAATPARPAKAERTPKPGRAKGATTSTSRAATSRAGKPVKPATAGKPVKAAKAVKPVKAVKAQGKGGKGGSGKG
jgi:hypothetical protein